MLYLHFAIMRICTLDSWYFFVSDDIQIISLKPSLSHLLSISFPMSSTSHSLYTVPSPCTCTRFKNTGFIFHNVCYYPLPHGSLSEHSVTRPLSAQFKMYRYFAVLCCSKYTGYHTNMIVNNNIHIHSWKSFLYNKKH